jgi:hypothetical protein
MPLVLTIVDHTTGVLMYSFPCRHTADTILASLLASATAALLCPRAFSRSRAQARLREGGYEFLAAAGLRAVPLKDQS